LREVALKALDDRQETPVAALRKSGLSSEPAGQSGGYMPKRRLLVEAHDRVVSSDET
jgi:hypothetical protein